MKALFTTIIFFLFTLSLAFGQQHAPDSLLRPEQFQEELLTLRAEVNNIQINLGRSEKRFKSGIIVATLGYSITIAGGLMLGRKQDDLGKALLIAGGATGITGTFLMVDAVKFLGRAARKKNP